MKQENSEKITPEDITLEFVTNNENIKMTDINNANDLSMYCYTNCDDNSNNLVKKTRGIVFNKDKIIVRSLGFTSDYTIHNKEIVNSNNNEPIWQAAEMAANTLIKIGQHNIRSRFCPDVSVGWAHPY